MRRVLDFKRGLSRNPRTGAMQNQQVGVPSKALRCGWSNRILLLATAGILFLTLYPFRLEHHVSPAGRASPLFLGGGIKSAGLFDAFLNVLLFVPFGFGLTEKLRERGKSLGFALVLALASGALFSYTIELLQFYIPQRDSGWEDVFTNTSGSLLGCIAFELLGKSLLRGLSGCESLLETMLTPRRTYIILLIYFALCCGASARLQRNTRLSNWRPDVLLVLGNDASGKFPWKGTLNAVQLWDLALRKEAAQQLSAGQPVDTGNPGLLVDYDFSAGPPFRNQRQVSAELAWLPHAPAAAGSGLLALDGATWLTSPVVVSDLVASLEKTISSRCTCSARLRKGAEAKAGSYPFPNPRVSPILRSARKTPTWPSGFAIRSRQTTQSCQRTGRECSPPAVLATSSIRMMARIFRSSSTADSSL
jgi:hypothetical protein